MDFMAIWKAIQGFIVGFIVRWVMVVAGSVIADAGLTEEDVVKIIAGVLMVIVSFIISLVQHKNAVEAEPK